MTIEQIDPEEAHRRMGNGCVYLDVRATVEFSRGHAQGARNVPLLQADPAGGMTPNEDFLAVCLANFPTDTRLVVGCASGGRSQRACELLAASGYTNLANIRGGFSGAHDQAGRMITKGWAALGLPVNSSPAAGTAYEFLAKSAGR